MATYRDTLNSFNTDTVGRIYPNAVEHINGQVHQDQDLAANATFFGHLLPLRGDAFRILRGGDTATAASNGAALVAAYNEAKLLTPFGNLLSATNRVTLLLFPGTYAVPSTFLLDTEFIDLVGIGNKEDIVVVNATSGVVLTLYKTADNIHLENFTLSNTVTGTGIAYKTFPGTGYANEVFTDMVFTSAYQGMWSDSYFNGTYVRCTCTTSGGFRASVPGDTVDVTGSFTDCVSGTSSFGGNANGATYLRCRCLGNGFGSSTATATFTECSATGMFGPQNALVMAGTYTDCSGDFQSFGFSGTLSGKFIRCVGGPDSFGKSGTISGTLTDCICTSNGGFAHNGTISGTLYGCIALGSDAFCREGVISGTLIDCVATGTTSFAVGSSSQITSTAVLIRCKAGNSSFGANGVSVMDGTFYDCIGGNSCFSSGMNSSGFSVNAKYYRCTAGDQSFSVGTKAHFSGLAVGCVGGDNCFAVSLAAGSSAPAIMDGTLIDCVAGNGSFGATTGSFGGATASGQFIRCIGGTGSFGSNGGGGTTGAVRATASGYFEDCAGGSLSFAGHIRGEKSGTFVRCTVRTGGTLGAPTDLGPLTATGVMRDCEWVMTTAATPALTVQDGAKVYGGRYIAGSGATSSIASADATAIHAKIANILTNVALDSNITNDITAPNVIVDADM
jgi:hypothetical protein